MTEQTGDPFAATEPNDAESSKPVAALAELSQKPTIGFLGGIRRRIQRRHLVSDTADFSVSGLSFIALEFLKMFFHLFQRTHQEKGNQ